MTSRDDARFHVNHFLVEDDFSAVSTNGAALHLVKRMTGLKPGYYKPLQVAKRLVKIEFTCTKEQAPLDYPDYNDIVREAENREGKEISFFVNEEDQVSYSQALAEIVRTMNKNYIDIRHLKNLANDTWDAVVPPDGEHPLYLTQGHQFRALIMPSRM
jgi:hypothetical protein